MKKKLTLKKNILNIQIIAVLVRILIALMHQTLPIEFIASLLILLINFGINLKVSKKGLNVGKIAFLDTLMQVSVLSTDLWMLTSIKS